MQVVNTTPTPPVFGDLSQGDAFVTGPSDTPHLKTTDFGAANAVNLETGAGASFLEDAVVTPAPNAVTSMFPPAS